MPTLFFIVQGLAVFVAALVAVRALDSQRRRRGLPYPPGPKGLPIIGSILDVPKTTPWITYARWAETYGDILSLQLLGKTLVVLQSQKAIKDLLIDRRAIYLDRPRIPFFELAGWNWVLATARGTEAWRVERRAVDRSLGPAAILQYQPMQKQKTHEFLKRLLLKPRNFLDDITDLPGSVIMSLVYGYDISEGEDQYLDKAKEFNNLVPELVQPGALLVNDLPFLKALPEWLPGMGFKKLARDGHKLAEEAINGPIAFVKAAMEQGTARPSMAAESLPHCQSEEDERHTTTALGSIYTAGADTTASTLSSFFLMLVLYPEVQKRAQAEIDAVTGGTALPDFGDRAHLPYVEALCKELHRWRMVGPTGLPHASIKDDVYEGYFIPKGSIVVANAWAILHDPELYPDPEVFRPERFLTSDGQPKDDPMLSMAFGFGGRICPGRHIVDAMLFIVVASVLSAFNVGVPKDAEGKDIPVADNYVGNALSKPAPFECSIVPRNSKVEELILMNVADEQ
ncbi:cytochrome P450 [Artomyces pyxidatus]|uniref:Cytochrome P450 n=1 Tax=Artomyces pyxidatus TaxID=48021 RepID=A0ACB8T0W5_9AGAM|nr:cytochrome P450 [Artomyces pyxidatus]